MEDVRRSYPHSTYRCYKKSCYANLIPHIGHDKIKTLAKNPEPIRDMIRKRHVAIKTINNDLTPLRAIFDKAITDDLIINNPLDRIKVRYLVNKEQKESYAPDPLSFIEIDQFLTTSQDFYPEWRNYFQFAFFTGLRPSELYALHWSNINWDRAEFTVKRAVVEGLEKETKTKSSKRIVNLLPMALEALKNQHEHYKALNPKHDNVWFHPGTRKPIVKYGVTSRRFIRILKLAGLRYRNQYQTRHSYASNLLSGGENPYRVAKQMGHKDVTMVMRIYGKWVGARQK